jgi:hypothetical protein
METIQRHFFTLPGKHTSSRLAGKIRTNCSRARTSVGEFEAAFAGQKAGSMPQALGPQQAKAALYPLISVT